MAQNTNITQSIKITGLAVRDWLGPYYTLGGLVAVIIGFCAFLDPSGWLVRGVTGLLLVATLITWSMHLVRKRRSAEMPAGPFLHHVLFAVTLFFCVGLVISEVLLHKNRSQQPATSAAEQTAPQQNQTTPPALQEPASAPAAPAVAAPLPSPSPSPSPASTPTPAPEPAASPQLAKPKPPAQNGVKEKPAAAPVVKPRAEARPAPSAADKQRCSDITVKFSQGQGLSDDERHFLKTTCQF